MSQTIEKTWRAVHSCLLRLFDASSSAEALDSKTIMTKPEYIGYYHSVFAYCTRNSSTMRNVPFQVGQTTATVHGKELYEKLRSFLISHVTKIRGSLQGVEDEVLLEHYRRNWDLFNFSRNLMNNIFSYLNKHCVPRAREAQLDNYFEIHILMLFIWRESLFMPMRSRLIRVALQMIDNDRSGFSVKAAVVRTFTDSLVAMGLEDREQEHCSLPGFVFQPQTNLTLYAKYFEEPLLDSTRAYYESEVQKFKTQNFSIADYAKQALERVEQEEDRLERYLHPSTRDPLNKVCHDVMIKSQLDSFHSEMRQLLLDNKQDDLRRVYSLLKRLPDSLKPISKTLEEHIKERGHAAIQACGNIGHTSGDAKKFITAVIDVHDMFSGQIREAFDSEPLFIQSLDKAFKSFVNVNSVTRREPRRSPELLAKYIDSLLKRTSKDDVTGDVESHFPKLMVVFKYLEDKDVFERFYKKNLARRLVQQQSLSDDTEAAFLECLKTQSGHEYVSKLQKMFNDVGTSKTLNKEFEAHLRQSSSAIKLDFGVQVLTMNAWPFQQNLPSIQLPQQLASAVDKFALFYTKSHAGRKLTWLHEYSKGEIQTLYLKKRYTFVANTVQICVLLQYTSDVSSLTISQFCAASDIPEETVRPQVEIMAKMRILKAGEDGGYVLNPKYSYKKLKVKIDQVIKSEAKVENTATHKAAVEERKFAIQACIVRVMKARNVIQHNDLIKEVIEQLQQRFKAQPTTIKKMVELLIDKEYMRRSDEDRKTYHYIA